MKRFISNILQAVLIAIIVIVITVVFNYAVEGKKISQNNLENNLALHGSLSNTVVLGEADSQDANNSSAYASENFRIKQISIGGEATVEVGDADSAVPLEISGVKSELYKSKSKDEIKILISFQTSKAAECKVAYAKKSGDSKTLNEDGYSYAHTMIIPALDPSSVYNYTIVAKDKSGNEKTSDKFVFYTGAPDVSLVDVLENATKKVFGWAIK